MAFLILEMGLRIVFAGFFELKYYPVLFMSQVGGGGGGGLE